MNDIFTNSGREKSMSSLKFPEQFSAKAGRVDSESSSTTKWHGVRNLLAEHLGLEQSEIYVTTISRPSNVRPRFFQSEGATDASLLVGMYTGHADEVPATLAATKKIAAKRGVSVVLATQDAAGWSVAVVLRPRGDRRLDSLAGVYPEAAMLPV